MSFTWKSHYSRTLLLTGSDPNLTALCAEELGDLLCKEEGCECVGKTWRIIGCTHCLISIYTPITEHTPITNLRERFMPIFSIYITIECFYPKALVKSATKVLEYMKRIGNCKYVAISLHH